MSVNAKSLEALEWKEMQRLLMESCKTEMGKRRAKDWGPDSIEFDKAQAHAQAIIELSAFETETQLKLPIKDIFEIEPILKRIERSGGISVEEFANLVSHHKGVQALSHFLNRYPKDCPNLKEVLIGIDRLEDWSKQFFGLLDQQGEIADSASPDLQALRKLARDLREKIKKRLEDYLHNPKTKEILQDVYVTVRQGRYVIPVKTNFKGKVPGIIHDLSKTEQTLFIEPESVVELNNQLKVAEKEIQLEIEKILAGVVRGTQSVVPQMRRNETILSKADLLDAAAALSLSWGQKCTCAEWKDEGFSFEEIRHPLLAIRENVIANSFSWQRGMVLTGPNTGGKTVLLKSVGLAFCLARSGIPVPAKACSFPKGVADIFVDIGDEQSLEEDLSTFSAHLKVLNEFMDNSSQKTLVLIDEIATATSPEEGECLAQAVLESLLDHGASFFVTTHYGRVKNFGMNDNRCRIAAMSFDTKSRRPTYDILLDIPGESSALDTAQALGVPVHVIDRARALRGEVSEDLRHAVDRLEKARQDFEERQKASLSAQKELESRMRQLDQKKKEYEKKLASKIEADAKGILDDFKQMRSELSDAVKAANKESLSGGAVDLFSQISDSSGKLKDKLEEVGASENISSTATSPTASDLSEGEVVEIAGLGLGKILDLGAKENLSRKSLILVQVGEIKTRVSLGRIRTASDVKIAGYEAIQKAQREASGRQMRKSVQTWEKGSKGSMVCDVRGKSVEEAMNRVQSALNDLTREDAGTVTIIHGHGSEKLKDHIRIYLGKSRTDMKFRPGSWPGEGGDGVTVVEKAEA